MVVNVSDVMSVYKKTGGAGGGSSFADTLKDFTSDAIATLHGGENAAIASATGTKTDLASVTSAISKAEIVLDEITTVRDKVISAYQTITSSAI